MRDYLKAQQILREMEGNTELMRFVKEGIEAQLKPTPKTSEVAEYVPHADGILQLEYRVTPKGTRRGPYWIFKYNAAGRKKSMYIGKKSLEEAKEAVDRADR